MTVIFIPLINLKSLLLFLTRFFLLLLVSYIVSVSVSYLQSLQVVVKCFCILYPKYVEATLRFVECGKDNHFYKTGIDHNK